MHVKNFETCTITIFYNMYFVQVDQRLTGQQRHTRTVTSADFDTILYNILQSFCYSYDVSNVFGIVVS